jgi:hypothetical protein
MFGWNRRTNKIEKDLAGLDSRVTVIETEMLPLMRSIDERTARLENHMSHIVAEAFGTERRPEE